MATARVTLADAISRFGIAVKAKLSAKAISGAPEDQLRALLEALLQDMVAVLGFAPANVPTY